MSLEQPARPEAVRTRQVAEQAKDNNRCMLGSCAFMGKNSTDQLIEMVQEIIVLLDCHEGETSSSNPI